MQCISTCLAQVNIFPATQSGLNPAETVALPSEVPLPFGIPKV